MIKLHWEWRKVDIMLTASSKMTTIAKKHKNCKKERQKFCKNDNAAQGG